MHSSKHQRFIRLCLSIPFMMRRRHHVVTVTADVRAIRAVRQGSLNSQLDAGCSSK